MGGQKTIRSYWRNYFEKTDALIWVVDATDRLRVGECMNELKALLLEEVYIPPTISLALANARRSATFRSQLVGIPEQDRYSWMHGRERGQAKTRA